VPQEERKVRRKFEVADRVNLTRSQRGGYAFSSIEEERAGKNSREGPSDAALEAALLHAVLGVHPKLIHVLVGNRTTICARGKRLDDLLRTDCLRIGLVGMAGEDAFAARRGA